MLIRTRLGRHAVVLLTLTALS